ncbi:hypothetical protein [Dyadobacter fermentans]|uniref:hypothetical protein n=1 Tax=Dyadobacter fermentans TaxID=94254 RepID=UPI001CBB48B1|nr:hypothetical protein [Dyadobacter fermentans]MBZ1363061.1 hypothetical protein [Dyadobacter fermentans]
MKTFALFSLFFSLLMQFSSQAQNLFYRHNGIQIKLIKSEKKSIIQTKNGTNISTLIKNNPSIDSLKELAPDQNFYVLFKNGATNSLRQSLNLDTDIISVNPVLITADGKELGFISEQIIVRLKPSVSVPKRQTV